MMASCAWGYADLARKLLEAGANPNSRDAENGFTAAMWAVNCGNVECLNILVDFGNTDWTSTCHGGYNVSLLAVIFDKPKILERMTTLKEIH